MKPYGDADENLRRFSILEMEGEKRRLHLSVLEEGGGVQPVTSCGGKVQELF